MLSAALVAALVALFLTSSVTGNIIGTRGGISADPTPGKLRVVENSGVCETTSGVYQASGYGDIASDGSVWFWFFEARHNPDTAPLSVWIQGEGGTSSMVGLLTGNGPCLLNEDGSSVSLNPSSWNEVSNVLYIDQPVGVGFSYGSRNITTSEAAAADVWQFLQIFFADSRFTKYQKNDFGLWSQWYGANLVSTFATYFLDQNDAIDNGTVSGTKINVKNVGIGGPYMDPLTQLPRYLDYAAGGAYGQLVSTVEILAQDRLWYATDNSGVQAKVQNCYSSPSDDPLICWDAVLAAEQNFIAPLYGNSNPANIKTNQSDPSTTPYLSNPDILSKIGAVSNYTEDNIYIAYGFDTTGTWIRNSRPLLEGLINNNITTLMWTGDADFFGNNEVTEILAEVLDTPATANFYFTEYDTYTVQGQEVGQFKVLPPFSYVRISGAGHNLGDFTTGSLSKGETFLQIFNQTVNGQTLQAT